MFHTIEVRADVGTTGVLRYGITNFDFTGTEAWEGVPTLPLLLRGETREWHVRVIPTPEHQAAVTRLRRVRRST